MRFGSDEMFQIINDNIRHPEKKDYLYNEIFHCVNKDGAMLLRKKGISENDLEMLLQELQLKVFKNLARFYLDSVQKSYTETQRNAWLNTCVNNLVVDFLRSNGRSLAAESLEDIPVDIRDTSTERRGERIIFATFLFEAIRSVTLLKKSAVDVMIYLLNRVSSIQNQKNGKPSEIASTINGMTVEQLYYGVKRQIEMIVEAPIPQNYLDKLWEHVQAERDITISVDTRKISDIANKMKKRVKAMDMRIFAEPPGGV